MDVRTTAEAILAILACGEGILSPNLQYASDFLLTSFKNEERGGSWGSELWDTALAIRALHQLAPKGAECIDRAFEWIWTKQLSDGSFDGEPWDTLFVTIVALELGKIEQVSTALNWLLGLQAQTGCFISKHYTGLFCQALGRAIDLEPISAQHSKLQQAAIRAIHFMWDNYDELNLWTGGTWTNAYIIQGLLSLRHPQLLGQHDNILEWYRRRQLDTGVWDDCVRTAIVLQALVELKVAFQLERCSQKPLQTFTFDFVSKTTRSEVLQIIQSRVTKAPIIRSRKFIEKDESGDVIITLTPERKMYAGIGVSVLAGLWWAFQNWALIRHFLFR